MTVSFGTRLQTVIGAKGGLCVGIDPHARLLDEWGIARTAEGVLEFGRAIVHAAVEAGAGAVKPQVAFFEAYGSAGFAALEQICIEASKAKLLVIADAKRADIGSSNAGYADAWLRDSSPFVCDALTVSPYLGVDSLADLAEVALSSGRGLFVLAATSNPEAADLQEARIGVETTVSARVLDVVDQWNRAEIGDDETALGSVGVVLGATVDCETRGIDSSALPWRTPILAPGFGAQGAVLEDAGSLFPDASGRLLANVGRSLLNGGRDGLIERVQDAVVTMRANRD